MTSKWGYLIESDRGEQDLRKKALQGDIKDVGIYLRALQRSRKWIKPKLLFKDVSDTLKKSLPKIAMAWSSGLGPLSHAQRTEWIGKSHYASGGVIVRNVVSDAEITFGNEKKEDWGASMLWITLHFPTKEGVIHNELSPRWNVHPGANQVTEKQRRDVRKVVADAMPRNSTEIDYVDSVELQNYGVRQQLRRRAEK